MAHALIIDDSTDSRSGLVEWLGQHGFESPRCAGTVEQARKFVEAELFDLILLDLELPDGHGFDLLKELENQPDAEVVIITGHGTIDSAVEAMRGGAIDYLTKPVDFRRLRKIIEKLQQTMKLRKEVSTLRGELRRMGRFGDMIGASPVMQKVYDLIARVAPTSSTVLVTGETGTGKELVAQTVHQLSRRSTKPFLAINCGAVAPNLIESELFGHERGSFTGADRQHKGIFERADGGTLFLDEITEMPLALQVKLLRILETQNVTRIGGDRSVAVDVRMIAASNRDVNQAVQEGKLREDLLYRLNVFPIHVPPVRDREDDIDRLANYFLAELNKDVPSPKRFSPGALRRLRAHPWPGNVRELRNVTERAFIIATDQIDPEHIPLEGAPVGPLTRGSLRLEPGTPIAEAERRLILATLDHLGGDKKKSAELLGISLKTLYNRLGAYGPKDAER